MSTDPKTRPADRARRHLAELRRLAAASALIAACGDKGDSDSPTLGYTVVDPMPQPCSDMLAYNFDASGVWTAADTVLLTLAVADPYEESTVESIQVTGGSVVGSPTLPTHSLELEITPDPGGTELSVEVVVACPDGATRTWTVLATLPATHAAGDPVTVTSAPA